VARRVHATQEPPFARYLISRCSMHCFCRFSLVKIYGL
jgi:hypothetical protein